MQGLSEYQGQLIFVLEPGEKVSSDEENEKLYLRPNFSFDPSLGILSFCDPVLSFFQFYSNKRNIPTKVGLVIALFRGWFALSAGCHFGGDSKKRRVVVASATDCYPIEN